MAENGQLAAMRADPVQQFARRTLWARLSSLGSRATSAPVRHECPRSGPIAGTRPGLVMIEPRFGDGMKTDATVCRAERSVETRSERSRIPARLDDDSP